MKLRNFAWFKTVLHCLFQTIWRLFAVIRGSDKIIWQLWWRSVNKRAFTRNSCFFSWLFPRGKHFHSAELRGKKNTQPDGSARAFQTCPDRTVRVFALTRSPQTHRSDQMSFDLHVMFFLGLYSSHSQTTPSPEDKGIAVLTAAQTHQQTVLGLRCRFLSHLAVSAICCLWVESRMMHFWQVSSWSAWVSPRSDYARCRQGEPVLLCSGI